MMFFRHQLLVSSSPLSCFKLAFFLNKRTKSPFLNPLLLGIAFSILFLLVFRIDYAAFDKGGSLITLMLGPATIILAVPLYRQRKYLKRDFIPIVVGCLIGSLTSVVSVILLSKLFQLDPKILLSLCSQISNSGHWYRNFETDSGNSFDYCHCDYHDRRDWCSNCSFCDQYFSYSQ